MQRITDMDRVTQKRGHVLRVFGGHQDISPTSVFHVISLGLHVGEPDFDLRRASRESTSVMNIRVKRLCNCHSAIVRIFLVYSAFETYARCLGINPCREHLLKAIQDSVNQSSVVANVRSCDPGYALFYFVIHHLTDKKLAAELKSFTDGQDVNVSLLARCIRHVFAHGILSASSSGLDGTVFDCVVSNLSGCLLDSMDIDFDRRVI